VNWTHGDHGREDQVYERESLSSGSIRGWSGSGDICDQELDEGWDKGGGEEIILEFVLNSETPSIVFTGFSNRSWLTHMFKSEHFDMDIQMNPLALLREHEPVLKKRFGVAKIGIFGSFVRGEERLDSDVDVLVMFRNGEKTFDNYMGTKFYLEDLFLRKVDLVTDAALKPLIREPILRDVIYA
jgi:hypothetical protein